MSDRHTRFEGEDLTCIRGDRTVFAGLSFAVAPGEALVLRGPNGSGKSSLLRLAAGLLAPARGALRWHDGAVGDIRDTHNDRLVYVGHHDAVKPVLTVAENLLFWARLQDAQDAVAPALALAGLSELATVPGQFLSAGQRRRLNLARLYLRRAALWLLDEPSVGLDRDSLAALEAGLRDHRAEGGMVMIATHTEIALPLSRTLELGSYAGTGDEALAL